MNYRVFENGKPCSEYHIRGWEQDTFETFEEAKRHAHEWAYPWSFEESDPIPMEIGKEYNMSMTEFPVMMKIEVVE